MTRKHFILDMYLAIDAKNPADMCQYLTDDASFRFANMPAVEGKSNIIAFLDGFFVSIKNIKHTDIEYWNSRNAWFVTGYVTYTRHNDTTLSVPFGVLLKMEGDLVKEYLIFVDSSTLFQ